MTRVRRLMIQRRRNRRNIIKIMFIALLIGMIGTTGSYSYFLVQQKVNTDLRIKTGIMKVSFVPSSTDLNFSDLQIGVEQTKNFNFTNNGEINETVDFEFVKVDGDLTNYLQYFNYALTFKKGDSTIKTYSGTLSNLFGAKTSLIYEGTSSGLYPLEKGSVVNAELKITLDPSIKNCLNTENILSFKQSQLRFKVVLYGKQLNDIKKE